MRYLSVSVASIAGVTMSSAVLAAETVMFDIPSGYQNDIVWSSESGFDERIDVRDEYMAFKQNGFASEGAVRAWDHGTGSDRKGKIYFDTVDAWQMTGMTFDISGFRDFASSVRLKVMIDGDLFKDKTWSFSGNEDFMTKAWDFGTEVSSVKITLENLNGNAYTGLDNISFSTVPAPGALALLGLAGVVGSRRRRS